MYRYIDIDLTRGADDVCSSYTIGRDGEHIATAFRVKLPDKFVNSNIVFEFKLSDGSGYSSKVMPFEEELVFAIEEFLMVEGLMTVSIVATDVTTGAVVKPFQKMFVVSNATNVLPRQGIPYGVASDHEERLKKIEGNRSDMEENNPEALDFIRNRTHYETEPTTLEWNGNVDGKESIPLMEYEDDGELIQYVLYKIADEIPMPEAFLQLQPKDVEVVMSGESVSGEDAFGESFEVMNLADGKIFMVVPVIAYCVEDNVTTEIPDTDGMTVTLNKGLWFIRVLQYGETMYVKSVTVSGVKQLDLKFIPDVAFAKAELKYGYNYVSLVITDRYGKKQSATIYNGQNGATFTPHISADGVLSWTNDRYLTNPTPVNIIGENGEPGYSPVRGTDYWTEEDIQSMKDYIDDAIFNSEW